MSSKKRRAVPEKKSYDEESSDEDSLFDFQIMEFIKRGRKPIQRRVDIVIKPWINIQKGRMMAQFMDEPYTEEDKKLIHDLAKNLAPAPADWPWFTVIPRGHARTYKEAERRLQELEVNEYAFTNDSENPESKAAKIERKFRNRNKKLKVSEETCAVLRVPSLSEAEDEDESLMTVDPEYSRQKSVEPPSSSEVDEETNKDINEQNDQFLDKPSAKKREQSSNAFTLTQSKKNMKKSGNIMKKKGPSSKEKQKRIIHQDRGASPKMSTNDKQDVNHNPQKTSDNIYPHEDFEKGSSKQKPKKIIHKDRGASPKISHNDKQDVNSSHQKTRGKAYNFDRDVMDKRLVEDGRDVPEQGKSNSVKANFYETVIKRLTAIESELKAINGKHDRILENLATNMQAVKIDFITKYELELPLRNIDDFNFFDRKLKDDEEFRNAFKSCLPTYFDGNRILRRSIIKILKKFLSKNLPPKFTVTKKKGDKYLFNQTTAYRCIFDILKCSHVDKQSGSEITEQRFASDFGIALRGAKDWEGGRKFRGQDDSPDETSDDEN